jgi:hypothetical protein
MTFLAPLHFLVVLPRLYNSKLSFLFQCKRNYYYCHLTWASQSPRSKVVEGSCLLADFTTCFTQTRPWTTAPEGTIYIRTPGGQQPAANLSQYQNSFKNLVFFIL